jgi:hypothetical protein
VDVLRPVSQLPFSESVSSSEQAFIDFQELLIEIYRNANRRNAMKIANIILTSAALLALASPAVFAQQAAANDPMTINQRKENQQDRIAQGVNSGQLTAGETKNLETKESALNREEHGMRAADNGHLTAADRATLNHQQNKLSRQIYNKKHNGRTQ